MLLIAAALGEELKTGMCLCHDPKSIAHRNISFRQAVRNGKAIGFLKTGVGPRRSSLALEAALDAVEVSLVLVIGYAGALDPGLKVGDLVAVRKALAFSLDEADPAWENVRLDGTFSLTQSDAMVQLAGSLGLRACEGDVMTSPYVLGDPGRKKMLYDRYHASIVDMETAALARVAASRAAPLSCVRVISDEARDTFLAPFSHDPGAGLASRAGKLLGNGMVQTYREWKTNTQAANKSLTRFLSGYL